MNNTNNDKNPQELIQNEKQNKKRALLKDGIYFILSGVIFILIAIWIAFEINSGSSTRIPIFLYIFYSLLGVDITTLIIFAISFILMAIGIYEIIKSRRM